MVMHSAMPASTHDAQLAFSLAPESIPIQAHCILSRLRTFPLFTRPPPVQKA
jgi:hypothetical protein